MLNQCKLYYQLLFELHKRKLVTTAVVHAAEKLKLNLLVFKQLSDMDPSVYTAREFRQEIRWQKKHFKKTKLRHFQSGLQAIIDNADLFDGCSDAILIEVIYWLDIALPLQLEMIAKMKQNSADVQRITDMICQEPELVKI